MIGSSRFFATAAFLQSRRERITTRAFPGACYSHGKSWTRFAPSLAAKPICPQTSCANRKARDWGIACNAPRGALSGARSFPSPRVRIRPRRDLCLNLSTPLRLPRLPFFPRVLRADPTAPTPRCPPNLQLLRLHASHLEDIRVFPALIRREEIDILFVHVYVLHFPIQLLYTLALL